jgi:hypothetical protein
MRARLCDPTNQNFPITNFDSGSAGQSRPPSFFLRLSYPLYTAVNMANQTDAPKTTPLAGMAHSEAHYFNRYYCEA